MEISYSRKAEGVATICGPIGEIAEIKTVTCGHCNRIMYISPFGDGTLSIKIPREANNSITTLQAEPPAVCHQCWTLVCPRCHTDGRCTPLLRRVEEEYSKKRMFEAVGI